jgi:hypothetical protein
MRTSSASWADATQSHAVPEGVDIRSQIHKGPHEEDEEEIDEDRDVETTPLAKSLDMLPTGSGRLYGGHGGSGHPRLSPQNNGYSKDATDYVSTEEPNFTPTTLGTSYYSLYEDPVLSTDTGTWSSPLTTAHNNVPEPTYTAASDTKSNELGGQGLGHGQKQIILGTVTPIVALVALICLILIFHKWPLSKSKGEEKGKKDGTADVQEMSSAQAVPVAAECTSNRVPEPRHGMPPPQYCTPPEGASSSPSIFDVLFPPPSHTRPPHVLSLISSQRNYNTGLNVEGLSNASSEVNSVRSEPPPVYRSTEASIRTGASSIHTPAAELTEANLLASQDQMGRSPFDNPEPERNPFDDGGDDGDDVSEMSASTLERDLACRSEVSSISYQASPPVLPTSMA